MSVNAEYILEHFDEALAGRHIKAFFQPIIRTLTGAVCCAEALARWEDPRHGLLSPADFIPVLESQGLIYRLDMAILDQACAMYRALADSGRALHSLSVNFSRLDFSVPTICEDIERTLAAHRVPHEAIKIEVTESVMMADQARFREVFRDLHGAGFSVWVDDFGSGFSSLGLLQAYDFDLLKIDMAFMRDYTARSRNLVAAIVHMAKDLGILTLIEGVETEEQLRFVKSVGCEAIQGFHYARPMNGQDLPAYLEAARVEPAVEKDYWNKVGHFNLLTSNPFEEKRADPAIQSDIPLALIECTWGRGDYVYANDAYIASVHRLGFDSIQALEHFFNDKISLRFNPFKNLLTEAVMKDTVQEVDYMAGEVFYTFRAKCIAKSRELNRAMVVATLSTFNSDDGKRDGAQYLRNVQSLYVSYEHVNLVYPDRNASTRVFSKANFQTAHQLLGLRDGILSFADKEVHPDDRARYLRFFDVDTLEQRLGEQGFIQQSFRVRDISDGWVWRQIRITRIPSVLERVYLYTIQTMSDVSIRIAEMLVSEHPELLE